MRKRIFTGLIFGGVCLLGVALVSVREHGSRAEAQTLQQTQQPTTPVMGGHPDVTGASGAEAGMDEAAMARLKHRQELSGLSERHQHMAADADKLLQLATELKADVDKSSKNETSVSAYNKADAIERLAHDVKQRLKN
jgi:sirohydrochlorin ferrochelatase